MSQTPVFRFLAATAALVGSPLAMAGIPPVSIVYSPNIAGVGTQAVPSLSEWGLIALCMLVLAIAYRMMRAGAGARPVATVLLAGALGAGAISDQDLVGKVVAAIPAVNLAQSDGGTAYASYSNVDTRVENTSGVPQQIKSIQVNFQGYWLGTPTQTPQCVVGTVVTAGASCYVYINTPQT